MDYIIELINVKKSFKKRVVFSNVSLQVIKGETVGLVGENGCGKSVLFKIIVGLMRPDMGDVFVRSEKVGLNTDFPINVGILINSPGYIDLYSGYENLKFLANITKKADKNDILNTMKKVGLDPYDKTKVKNYSVGMKQKLGIAQAIMEDQDILILDEPFNGLDYKTKDDIINIIRLLQNQKKTILITSHNFQDIQTLCNKTYIIENKNIKPMSDEMKLKYKN
ncbi:ATP-binding cassette domain-containing protein [Alkalibaculum sp. M08DMB]|uniref:ATP-binding cassette domain-containing protein n=1 Tax=Alkalibaculum sporogenes TaxID=2655001 RepID=A0A6A7KAH1_9FIRM|nr:ABC transporter ATP-binding protein [Alkalibaculum sporogenes]MPW26362.1 ATP-binding cassette domain-containing protein [Alkalibaculum sporogenes]